MKEENCIVLDFLASGYADRRRSESIAQAIGTSFFSLLEVIPREGIALKSGEEAYIGDGKRDKVRFIRGQIDFSHLTNLAQSELPQVVEDIIKKNEQRFVEFFNKSGMISLRMHQLQLLPGIGKKHLLDILDERKKKPFESFADITERGKLPDPMKAVVHRVMDELKGKEKYYLFVRHRKIIEERYYS